MRDKIFGEKVGGGIVVVDTPDGDKSNGNKGVAVSSNPNDAKPDVDKTSAGETGEIGPGASKKRSCRRWPYNR